VKVNLIIGVAAGFGICLLSGGEVNEAAAFVLGWILGGICRFYLGSMVSDWLRSQGYVK
jgi:hypothetical protein